MGAQMLVDLGATQLRLLTNNPRKIVGLEGYGVDIVSREPLRIPGGARSRSDLADSPSLEADEASSPA